MMRNILAVAVAVAVGYFLIAVGVPKRVIFLGAGAVAAGIFGAVKGGG